MIDQDITIGSQKTASYEIDESVLGSGYKLYTSTGKNTTLQWYRYELGGPSGTNVTYQEIDGLEMYSMNQGDFNNSDELRVGEVIWGANTNIQQIYSLIQKINPNIQKYCTLEINTNEDASISAFISYNKNTQGALNSLSGDSQNEIMSICNSGTIYCKNSSKNGECEYRYNFKNGGGRSNIVIASLKKLK